jgi:hypothetical protein
MNVRTHEYMLSASVYACCKAVDVLAVVLYGYSANVYVVST